MLTVATDGLLRAAVLGLRLIGTDKQQRGLSS
jgi:hypothetical protein